MLCDVENYRPIVCFGAVLQTNRKGTKPVWSRIQTTCQYKYNIPGRIFKW